jgi:NitT/TauT family transport system substrate-binding protein
MSTNFGRRRLLQGGVALGALAGMVGAGELAFGAGGGPAPGSGLRVGYLPITDAAPLLTAHALGLYERSGVDVQRPVLFRSWASLAEALLARKVDVVHVLMPMAVQLRYAFGADVRVLSWCHVNGSALTTSSDVHSVADLAGRKVAIPHWWSIQNVVLQETLRGAGLRPVVREQSRANTVELVVMSPADMLPALQNGAIGGYVVADPFNAAAETKQVGRILRFTGDVWRSHACCVVAAHHDLADGQAQAVLDAVAGAQAFLRQHRSPGARLLSSGYLPQPTTIINRALTYPTAEYAASGAVQHPEWTGNLIDFQPFPFPSFTERLIQAMRETVVDGDTTFLQHAEPATVHKELVDDRFARDAIARLGGPAAFGLPDSLARSEEVNTG